LTFLFRLEIAPAFSGATIRIAGSRVVNRVRPSPEASAKPIGRLRRKKRIMTTIMRDKKSRTKNPPQKAAMRL